VAALDGHQPGVDELCEVMGQRGLRDLEQRQQLALADGHLAAAQHVEDIHAQRLGQRLSHGGDPAGVKARIEPDRRRATR
jgi:hypothetical protein